jgi:hypothetical protein
MIRWREERRRSFRAIAALLVALLVGGFVRIALGLVLAAAAANAAALVAIVIVIAVFVFRAAGSRENRNHDPYG